MVVSIQSRAIAYLAFGQTCPQPVKTKWLVWRLRSAGSSEPYHPAKSRSDLPEEIGLAVERFLPRICHRRQVLRMELSHDGVEAMPKPESFPIDKIYVPVKRKKALKPELVQEIAESILEIGQQAPVLVRPDEGRFVLVEGLHRFEACKALGEKLSSGSWSRLRSFTKRRFCPIARK